ncbi:hypothetical protein FDA94_25430 [Herbidospora galbida]|uniref:Uncharacterized protein n=1 Tax=Herbidospora galbida TaxID=2575442 RepID=A0A4U3M925_9ACTN|nr:hypothetical protein [Herbidospora galbida]TKK85485.1 hypothetical protein FDA94_25430 [Herbidospora galbida]
MRASEGITRSTQIIVARPTEPGDRAYGPTGLAIRLSTSRPVDLAIRISAPRTAKALHRAHRTTGILIGISATCATETLARPLGQAQRV